jgi:hypothetical protein
LLEASLTRTLLAIAAAALIAPALLASTAEACISCEYVPEVVRNHTTDNPAPRAERSYEPKVYKKERSSKATEERKSRPAKNRVVKSQPAAEPVKTAKAAPAPAAADSENENSGITTGKAGAEPAKKLDTASTEPATTKTVSENSTITTATLQKTETAGSEQTASTEEPNKVSTTNVGCKKFFPVVGLTLSVPCE